MSENRLSRETSPYLLQHKANPVHWWAWGPEALAEAKRTNRPILLSVGYAACHWCHVMAHESFEDEATAAVMNDLFVNIKVDREERPDIDAIYMGALHRLGEQGGWPLTMFLDSEARPFWGGTYFPKVGRWGRPAFADVLRRVSEVFHKESDKVAQNAATLTQMLVPTPGKTGEFEVTDALLRDLTQRMVRAVDPVHGGLMGAPKFPQWSFFWLLWRGAIRYGHEPAKHAVVTTLTHICQGGIYDHLGGGFARYSVDERWLAPHFEKMLYDNALLIDLLTEVWRETRNPLFKERIAETVAWLEREMIAEGGGFAASLDADSEGEEGKFYVWSEPEIVEVLGADDAAFFGRVYDMTPEGNWEGHTILNRLRELEGSDPTGLTPSPTVASRVRPAGSDPSESEEQLAQWRAKLFARRATRIRPGWDDKVLADWNGLMIGALARASRVFDEPGWLTLAERAFAFVEENLQVGTRSPPPGGEGLEVGGTTTGVGNPPLPSPRPHGGRERSSEPRLFHSYRDGRAKAPGTASDYANMIWAALRLYQATVEPRYLDAAKTWTNTLDRHFWDATSGGYFTTADDTNDVIVRLKSAHDDATPSANAVMVGNLAMLALLTGEGRYADRAQAILMAFAGDLAERAVGHTGLIASALDVLAPQLVVVAGDDDPRRLALADSLNSLSLPGAAEFFMVKPEAGAAPALDGKTAIDDRPAAYACLGPHCSLPMTNALELERVLLKNRRA